VDLRQVHDNRLVGNRSGKRRRVLRETRPEQQSWRSREHRPSPRARRLGTADDSFGRRQRKRGDPFRGSPSPFLWSRSFEDLVRAAPLRERSLSDRSYLLASVVIGMTWTYLRPSLPSRNATLPSVRANKV